MLLIILIYQIPQDIGFLIIFILGEKWKLKKQKLQRKIVTKKLNANIITLIFEI